MNHVPHIFQGLRFCNYLSKTTVAGPEQIVEWALKLNENTDISNKTLREIIRKS